MGNSKQPTVMVLGANGHLGRAAVLAFAAQGWQVWAHVRRAPRGPLPPNVTLVQADALEVDKLAAAAPRLDVIVHALNPDYTKWAQFMPAQTQAVLALAKATGATVMLHGNVYNFGNELPPVLTEQTPFVPTHEKARLRVVQEADLAQAARTQGVRSIVIRAGDFLGDQGTWLDLGLARELAKGRFAQMGPSDLAHAWAYLPDLARVFALVAQKRAELAPHTVLHYAGLTLTGAQFQTAFEAALGRQLKTVNFPWWLMRLIAPVAAMPRALVQQSYLWRRPHQLAEQRLAGLLGTVPHTPLAEVMRDCVAQLPAV
jgi:nucleoside-diphosphate-sugar epimerase